MATVDVPLERIRFGKTQRRDLWWAMPLTTFIVFSSFVVYVTWALFQGEHYHYGNYLSPLYSPELFGTSPHALFGPWKWPWVPYINYSPAMLILIFPLSFRLTCYYYRGAYYKAFWADPPACAVGEPRDEYRGEAKWPLLIHNIHRYAMYAALAFIVLLSIDAVNGFRFNNPKTGHATFGIGVGSLVLLINVVLLSGYTLGCHSLRHLVVNVVDYVEPKPGIPPTPAHTLDLINLMKRDGVKLILVEPYFDLRTPNSIASNVGGEVLVLMPSVGGNKEVTNYFQLFDYDINLLVNAFAKLK